MDIAYLRAHPEHLPTFLTHQRIRETPVSGGNICAASRLTLDDGASVFAKTWPEGREAERPAGFFETEAAGLRWLRETGTVPVPEVITALPGLLALEWVEPGPASRSGAERFGRELAALHLSGAPAFGAPPPDAPAGFIGALPQDTSLSDGPWGPWFAEHRLRPYLRMGVDREALDDGTVAAVEAVLDRIEDFGGAEPPCRIHGDLWPGNVLWGADGRARLVDPAAHGGHRETDLAQLALFGGAAHLEVIIAGYAEAARDAGRPLDDGWRARVPLHQLHLYLVHVALFGAVYRQSVRDVTDMLRRR